MSKNKTKKRRHPFLVFYALFVTVTVLLAAWFYLPIDSFVARHDAERKGYTVVSQPDELDYKYYYNHLKSESEQEAYTLICSQLPDFPERIAVPNLSSDEVQEVYTAVSYDNPEFFFLGNSCQYMRFGAVFYFQPTYSMTREQYIAQWDAVENEANALIADLDAGASDYDKELYIHDALAEMADYKTTTATESSVYTPYGLLVEHEANCEGYSRSMQYLLTRVQRGRHLGRLHHRRHFGRHIERAEPHLLQPRQDRDGRRPPAGRGGPLGKLHLGRFKLL